MDISEYNQYIERYFNNKKINGALMLTSSWGRGKSYYVDNFLVNHLKDKCVKVSLYGLKSLEDISKSIYLAVRFGSGKKSEALSSLKLIGKTISRGILSYFKINIDPKEKDLQSLFESIDLSDKLIILEDVERSSIDIVQILGYVNNLCEQEKYKVLLVVNENEILNDKEKTTKAIEYCRIKEKTVVDTLCFDCPLDAPIKNILESFAYLSTDGTCRIANSNFAKLLEVVGDSSVDTIKVIIQKDASTHCNDSYNLRSLIFACQKTIDLFEDADKHNISYSAEFFAACLFGIIAFSLRYKRDDPRTLKWENDMDAPELLGSENHPLLRVCFDYIQNQQFNKKDFEEAINNFSLLKQKDETWKKLKKYKNFSYSEFLNTICNLQTLIEKGVFSLESFGTVVTHLLSIKTNVGDDNGIIASCIDFIKNMIKETESALYKKYWAINPKEEVLLIDGAKSEYEAFKDEMSQFLTQQLRDQLIELTKNVEGITTFYKTIELYERESIGLLNEVKQEFASKIDIEGMVNQLLCCSPSVIADFTKGFLKIYDIGSGEGTDSNENFNMNRRKSLGEIYDKLPNSVKQGTIDNLEFVDVNLRNMLIELKEAIEIEIGSRSAAREKIPEKEINAIKNLSQKLEDTVNECTDKICSYHIKCLIDGLKKII
ncbi:MAG: KAP family NTPase [Ruminococcus flavefaciens]|nr:KAP family NTPase [Ruminococcus flavefaciens]